MPNMQGTGTPEIHAFIDYLCDKENDGNAAIAALARHVRSHCGPRPSAGFSQPPRWPSIDAMKASVRNYGPNCTEAQFDTAYAAFVAS